MFIIIFINMYSTVRTVIRQPGTAIGFGRRDQCMYVQLWTYITFLIDDAILIATFIHSMVAG